MLTGYMLYDGSSWSRIRVADAEQLVAWGSTLAVDFGADGLYVYDGSSWSRIRVADAEQLVAWGSTLAADFGADGLYVYDGSSCSASFTRHGFGWRMPSNWSPGAVPWRSILVLTGYMYMTVPPGREFGWSILSV